MGSWYSRSGLPNDIQHMRNRHLHSSLLVQRFVYAVLGIKIWSFVIPEMPWSKLSESTENMHGTEQRIILNTREIGLSNRIHSTISPLSGRELFTIVNSMVLNDCFFDHIINIRCILCLQKKMLSSNCSEEIKWAFGKLEIFGIIFL